MFNIINDLDHLKDANNKPIIISHKKCKDGLLAAYALAKLFDVPLEDVFFLSHKPNQIENIKQEQKGELYDTIKLYQKLAINHNTGDFDVVLVDYSFAGTTLEWLFTESPNMRLTVLDHHKGADEEYNKHKYNQTISKFIKDGKYRFYFNNQLSGCVLALYWYIIRRDTVNYMDKFKVPSDITELNYDDLDNTNIYTGYPHYQYIQDGDIWIWKNRDSKCFIPYFSVYCKTLQDVDETFPMGDLDKINYNVQMGIGLGHTLNEQYSSQINEEYLNLIIKDIDIYGTRYKVGLVNTSGLFTSELGNKIVNENPDVDFALGYFVTKNGAMKCGLRSRPDFNCRYVAERFGGGGHDQAAGFTTTIDNFVDTFLR